MTNPYEDIDPSPQASTPTVQSGATGSYDEPNPYESIDPSPRQPNWTDTARQTTGVMARGAVHGVGSIVDLPENLINLSEYAQSKLPFSAHTPAYVPTPATHLADAFSDLIKLPKAQNANQRLIESVGQGLTGGAAFGPMGAVSGAAGGAGSQIAAESGGGTGAQLAAGFISGGGLSVPAVIGKEAAGAAINAGKNIINPATEANIGKIIASQASNPEELLANLQKGHAIYVPGSNPTTAEVGKDVGLIGEQKAFENNNPTSKIAELRAQNTAARNQSIQEIAGTPETIAAAKIARNDTTGPLREQAFSQYENDPRLPENQYVNYKTDLKETFGQFEDSDTSKKATQKDLQKEIENLGYTVTQAPSLSGKSNVFTATKNDPITNDPVTIKYRTGANPLPVTASPNRDFIDLANPAEGIKSLVNKLASGEPTKPVVNPNYPIGMAERRLKGPLGNDPDVADAMNGAIEALKSANNISNPEYAYAVKKAIQAKTMELMTKRGATGAEKLAAGNTRDITKSLDTQIENAAPGYKDYLAKYHEMSKPIEQMGELQDIQQKVFKGNEDIQGNSSARLNALNNILSKEGRTELEKVLTDQQMSRLDNLQMDLKRQSQMNAYAPTGSPTGANATSANKLNDVMSDIINAWTGKVPFIGKSIIKGRSDKINSALANAYANPSVAQQSLAKGLKVLQQEKQLPTEIKRKMVAIMLGSAISSIPPGHASYLLQQGDNK